MWASSALRSSALDGMQPTLRHTPPQYFLSTTATSARAAPRGWPRRSRPDRHRGPRHRNQPCRQPMSERPRRAAVTSQSGTSRSAVSRRIAGGGVPSRAEAARERPRPGGASGQGRSTRRHDTPAPPANKGLLAIAGVLLAIPMIALCWWAATRRRSPCSGASRSSSGTSSSGSSSARRCTYAAYRRRPQGPPAPADDRPAGDRRTARTADDRRRPRSDHTGVNGVALTVLIVLFLLVTVMGFWPPAGAGRQHGVAWTSGASAAALRHLGHLVPARRRPLHGLHLRRGAGGDVRRRRGQRLLRRPVHDRALPDHLHLHGPALVGQPPARLRHPGGLRRGRYGSRGLSLAVAITGILATMPYIALQLVGIQAVLEVAGRRRPAARSPRTCRCSSPSPAGRLHLLRGLRAPAVIAFVKDA